MSHFLQRHADSVMGMVSGWDRLRFRGTLRMLANLTGMMRFLGYRGHLLKDFGAYAQETSRQVRQQALAVVERADRPVVHLESPQVNKEQEALKIARRDGVSQGIIAALTAVESCRSYDIRSDRSRGLLELYSRPRKCQHIYVYRIHPVFGLMYTRLQTWFPFNIHMGINGREWLARRMDGLGMKYLRRDNCFTWVQNVAKVQALLGRQVNFGWDKALAKLSRQTNPALASIVGDYDIAYYWSIDQSEWASDVMFKNREDLRRVYPALIHQGMTNFASPEVMRFLGRLPASGRLSGNFSGEVISDYCKRDEGVRIKHWVNHNSLKMYDKGTVLRVETTLNNMRDFKAPRKVKGKVVYRPMRKGVGDIKRRAEVSQASNQRYLEALAAVSVPTPLKTLTGKLSRPIGWKGKSVRGLNLLGDADATLCAAVGRGEFAINGFRNRDLQKLLFAAEPKDAAEQRRRSGQITRRLRMLRAHGLINKVPHTHRYVVSEKGQQIIAALHAAREANVEKLAKAA
jgi:hypothetical protein